MKRNNNSKEHVKLYKSKKKWVAATIFTTALGIAGVAATENVSANGVNSSSVNSSSASQVSSSSVKSSSSVVLRSSSQSSAKKISTSSATSQSNNDATQSSAAPKASTSSSSSAQDKTAQEKSSLENQISQKQNDLKNEESQQSKVQAQYNADQQKVNKAVADQASKIAAVNETANEQKQSAQKTVDDLQNQETSQAKQDIQNQISSKQNDLNNVNSQISNTQSALTNAQNDLNSLKNSSQSGYNDSEGVVENIAHMDHNSHDYQLMFGPMYVTPDNDKANINWNDPVAQVNNSTYSSSIQQHDLINGHDLTQAQAKEICEALMAEINATREARGEQPFVMTDAMFNAMMERAAGPDHNQHSAEYIDKALEDNGISANDWRAECLTGSSTDNDVAQEIYDCQEQIFEMLNDDGDSQWGHRTNFLQNYGQPVQASFGIAYDQETGMYTLVFDVANYHGNGSDDLMNEVKSWENQTDTTDNSAQISAIQSKINSLQNQLSGLQSQKQSLENQISDLQNQANNVKFDESKLSLSDQQKYNDAQSTLKTIANWRQQQIDQINNAANSQNEPLYNKTAAEKSQLNDLNNQIAQTKQEIANLQNQLNNLNNKSSQSGTTTKPSTNTPADKPATKPVVTPSDHNSGHSTSSATPNKDNQGSSSATATDKPATKPSDNQGTHTADSSSSASTPSKNTTGTPVKPSTTGDKPAAKPSDNQGQSTASDQTNASKSTSSSAAPSKSAQSSSSAVADQVVANIAYNKGVDPLTDKLLSDETPAQRQKAKVYVEQLNKNVQAESSTQLQSASLTFNQGKVQAATVKDNAKKSLPTTGESQDKGAVVLGIEAASLGLALGGLSFLKRKKD
ncbi:KxYKxGKxW signal peptide domain-containing protein [Ligilactobacillus aviarius]|nr:KxYKxGKxW signal peptide domain-containing protein [Ligilactobacillus aviarius]